MTSSFQSPAPRPLRIALVSTYVPRECGIATYAEDVIHAVEPHGAEAQVIAMQRSGQQFAYDARVIAGIEEGNRASYDAMADLLNHSSFDVLSVQHEFGIYGGGDNDDLADFLQRVHLPVVVTLHTVLAHPSAGMRRNLSAIAVRADRIVVMNGLVLETLARVYGVELQKVVVIHHGVPVPHLTRGTAVKHALGMDDETVLSTFGLISSAKGLQYMVRAMPQVLVQRPNAVYYILGQTHPVIRDEEGERYRHRLEALADALGVAAHVRFIDRYLTRQEVMEYLLATDIYVTPYLEMGQVTSGTLAYAVGAGCPVVATPYLHARYLLDGGRGLLVPPEDIDALAQAHLTLLQDEPLRRAIETKNWEYGKTLYWPRVGAAYLQAFSEAARAA